MLSSADDCSDHYIPEGAGHGFSSFPSTLMTKLPEDSYSQKGPNESVVEVKQEPVVDDFGVESCDFYGGDTLLPESMEGLGLLPLSPKQSTEEEEEAPKLVTVKEENEEEALFGVGGSSSSSSSSGLVQLAKPMEGLQEATPPPFLKKTFQMVEDPGTNSIISWSNTRDSFVVWDLYEFSKVLLPQYFKHSNFSSFIRQLNTYGFRKIGSDRWEFANEEFQEGKRHLLKNIKRRSRPNSNNDNKLVGDSDLTKLQLQAQVETLKKDRNAMRSDVMKLRKQQEQSQNQIAAVEERMSHVECRQQQILIFLFKAGRNPNFVQQLMHKRKRKNRSEVGKKRRFIMSQNTLGLPEAMDTNQEADDCRKQVEKETLTCPNSMNEMSSCCDIQNEKDNNVDTGKCVTDICSDVVAKDDSNPQDFANYSKIFLELEDLIGKPCEL